MSRQGENIYKRRDGRWEGRIIMGRQEGRTRFMYVYGQTKQEAQLKKALKCRELASGSRQRATTVTPREESCEVQSPLVDLKTLGNEWLNRVTTEVKESTVAQYRNTLTRYIWPELGTLNPADITGAKAADFLTGLLTNGGAKGNGLAPKTVREIGGILKCLRAFALQRGYAVGYSAKDLTVKVRPKLPHTLSEPEARAIRDKLQASQDRRDIGIMLALATGIRIGELCALKGEDISLEEGILSINKTMQRISCSEPGKAKTKVVCSEPKTECSKRKIPLPATLCKLLTPYVKEGTYLLTGEADKYCEPRNLQYRFSKILKYCRIENATFHTLRHTFATRALELGMDIKSLSGILGHASVAITLNRYVHPSFQSLRQQMEKVDGFLEERGEASAVQGA